jgi:dipeptidyl aminopeptidase/acylaminoacyl peptidase
MWNFQGRGGVEFPGKAGCGNITEGGTSRAATARDTMRQRRMGIFLLFICILPLAACTPGHLGSNVIAFLRDGHLWTIDPNGTNAFEVAAQDTTIVGYSWSPSHQILAFRALDVDFAKTTAGKHLSSQAITGQIGDVPSTQNTIGVDGGSPIPIAFSNTNVGYSNVIWNTNSTRLLYRQSVVTISSAEVSPLTAIWFVSQNDQPSAIARKELPRSFSIPSFSYDSSHYLAIENSAQEVFTTTLAGTEKHTLSSALPGHPLPATLERILWRPRHQNQSFVYAVSDGQGQAAVPTTTVTRGAMGGVRLILGNVDGHMTELATCTCTQFAWSPDGEHLLYTTGMDYTILDIGSQSAFHVSGEDGSVPYWSQNGQFLVLEGQHSLQLISIQQKQAQMLLSDTQENESLRTIGNTQSVQQTSPDTLLQPVSNSIWSPDGRQFLFLTGQRLFWQGQKLPSGKGLYTISIDDHGHPQGTPTLVDRGNDSQAGWTYQDANTSFLF